MENKPPFITIAQSLQASFAQGGVKVDLLPAAGSQVLCPGTRETASGGDPPVDPGLL
ncbi:hypothetical protein LNO81_06780 [Klebsiella variicola subsp. variicola]|nr:hypothetical protein [Klebsiella variicola subsp. variicola]